MKLKDLITDSAEPDRMSHTKLWANVAYATATVVFALQAYKGSLDAEVWLIYLGIVGAHSAASKLIGMKYGQKEQPNG